MCKGMAVKLYSLTNSNSHADFDKPCLICSNKNKELKEKKKGGCKHETKIVKADNAAYKYSGFYLSVKFWGEAIPHETLVALFEFSGIYAELSKPTLGFDVPKLRIACPYIGLCLNSLCLISNFYNNIKIIASIGVVFLCSVNGYAQVLHLDNTIQRSAKTMTG